MKQKIPAKQSTWILIGIPVLFFTGSAMHFLYDMVDTIPIIGFLAAFIAPVNESIWEHCKLLLVPVITWWGLYYFVYGRSFKINSNKWFSGALSALLAALSLIPLLYYFYTGAFGIELIWIDVAIMLAAVTSGQLLGLHVYHHSKGLRAVTVIIVFAFIVGIFIVFTFYPPHLPLFQDGQSGTYGIR